MLYKAFLYLCGMKKMKFILLALFVFFSFDAAAQTKAETDLYNKTLKKPTVKAFDKFLKKYPESVYAPELMTMRDSTLFAAVDQEDVLAVRAFMAEHPSSPIRDKVVEVLRRNNTSSVSRADACGIAGMDAVGFKMDNHEYIVGVNIAQQGYISVSTYSTEGIKIGDDRVIAMQQMGDVAGTRFADSLCVVEVRFDNMLTFSYINDCVNGEQEHVTVLYDYRNDNAYSAVFYGVDILTQPSDNAYGIEGLCSESVSAGIRTAEQMWVLDRVNSNSSLVPISEANLLTDNSIKWWYDNNAGISSSAVRLNFGILDPKSSLITAYGNASAVKGEKYDAALFDFRGNTVIVACSKQSGEYLLVWCEPVCKNKDTDKLLNTIYFEGNKSTLVMFYYEGRTTYKYRLNLADKSLRK